MAATDSMPVPKKNTAFRHYFYLLDSDGAAVTSATGLDSEVSKDGGAYADCTNEATEVGQGLYYLDLTSTEMNADVVALLVKTSSSGAIPERAVVAPQETGDIPVTVSAMDSGVVTATAIADNAITSAKIATDAITSAQLASSAVTEINGSLATAIALTTVGTNVTAIKAKTDNLPSDPADASGISTAFSSLNTVLGSPAGASLAADIATANTNITGLDTKLGAPANASVSADIAAVKTETASILADTSTLPASPAATGDIPSASTVASQVRTELTTELGRIDAAVSSRLASASYTAAPTAAAVADAVCDEAVADHTTAGSVGASLASIYAAQIDFADDDDNSQDEYTVQWFKNGAPVTSGITVPTIQVIKRTDGTDLVAQASMTQIGSSGAYKYDVTSAGSRVSAGEAVVVQVTATIDGATRTWRRVVSRDAEIS
jgi:hypothetical protein